MTARAAPPPPPQPRNISRITKLGIGCGAAVLAVVAQVAEIHGTIKGTLYFKGQVLRVSKTARIENGAEIIAQSFVNDGTIEGELIAQTQETNSASD